MTERPEGAHYVLGHTPRELDRLDLQGLLYRDVTRRALLDGGVEEGMRVLDLGSGSGDVALLVAEIVGERGAVVGVERDAPTATAAAERARRRGAPHVAFHVGEIAEGVPGAPFDALVGRFVLMHQRDPSAVLTAAVHNIRPGGAVVLIESHMELLEQGVHSWPFSPVYDQVVRWKSRVVRAAGADAAMGLKLRRTFLDAGLPEPTTRLEAQVEGGPGSVLYRYLAESVASMVPMALRSGIEGFDLEGTEALEDALRAETTRTRGVLVNWPVVSAWSRVPPL